MNHKQDLAKRIAEAKQDQKETKEENLGIPAEEETSEEKQGKKAASQFMGLVIAGVIFGILVDRSFETAPFGLFFFIIAGFIGAVFQANAIINKKE